MRMPLGYNQTSESKTLLCLKVWEEINNTTYQLDLSASPPIIDRGDWLGIKSGLTWQNQTKTWSLMNVKQTKSTTWSMCFLGFGHTDSWQSQASGVDWEGCSGSAGSEACGDTMIQGKGPNINTDSNIKLVFIILWYYCSPNKHIQHTTYIMIVMVLITIIVTWFSAVGLKKNTAFEHPSIV